jgi:hypothetical protein
MGVADEEIALGQQELKEAVPSLLPDARILVH